MTGEWGVVEIISNGALQRALSLMGTQSLENLIRCSKEPCDDWVQENRGGGHGMRTEIEWWVTNTQRRGIHAFERNDATDRGGGARHSLCGRASRSRMVRFLEHHPVAELACGLCLHKETGLRLTPEVTAWKDVLRIWSPVILVLLLLGAGWIAVWLGQ